jgi:hypothetical protein
MPLFRLPPEGRDPLLDLPGNLLAERRYFRMCRFLQLLRLGMGLGNDAVGLTLLRYDAINQRRHEMIPLQTNHPGEAMFTTQGSP